MKNDCPKPEEEKNGMNDRLIGWLFLPGLLVYILLCGYVLVFAGSLFFEAVFKGWFHQSASDFDNYSLWLGYLYGFPCLLGVLGGVTVLSTGWERFYKYKVLFFIPSAVWSAELVLGNFRWGFTYWTEWLYLVPVMSLCMFILYCAANKINIPILAVGVQRNVSVEK